MCVCLCRKLENANCSQVWAHQTSYTSWNCQWPLIYFCSFLTFLLSPFIFQGGGPEMGWGEFTNYHTGQVSDLCDCYFMCTDLLLWTLVLLIYTFLYRGISLVMDSEEVSWKCNNLLLYLSCNFRRTWQQCLKCQRRTRHFFCPFFPFLSLSLCNCYIVWVCMITVTRFEQGSHWY